MARPVTSNIRGKKKKSFHLSAETIELMEQCQIDVENELRRRVEKTPFVNALIAIAADHPGDIVKKLRTRSKAE